MFKSTVVVNEAFGVNLMALYSFLRLIMLKMISIFLKIGTFLCFNALCNFFYIPIDRHFV